jgi:hypothetical protein
MQQLIDEYKQLINVTLPSAYKYPVQYNHCFNRIILDWLFKDCWYNHIKRKQTAISQLTKAQLQLSINRMKAWLKDQSLLIADNNFSLACRKKENKF